MGDFITLAIKYGSTITVKYGANLQRLFSMFPGGWPGAGLLLLRLAAAFPLMFAGIPELRGGQHSLPYVVQIVAVGVGGLLLAGLWTPIAGALKAVIELWILFSSGDAAVAHLLRAGLFGRKRIDIRRR